MPVDNVKQKVRYVSFEAILITGRHIEIHLNVGNFKTPLINTTPAV